MSALTVRRNFPRPPEALVKRLRESGIEVVYTEFPGRDHFAVVEWSLIGKQTLAFLDRHLG